MDPNPILLKPPDPFNMMDLLLKSKNKPTISQFAIVMAVLLVAGQQQQQQSGPSSSILSPVCTDVCPECIKCDQPECIQQQCPECPECPDEEPIIQQQEIESLRAQVATLKAELAGEEPDPFVLEHERRRDEWIRANEERERLHDEETRRIEAAAAIERIEQQKRDKERERRLQPFTNDCFGQLKDARNGRPLVFRAPDIVYMDSSNGAVLCSGSYLEKHGLDAEGYVSLVGITGSMSQRYRTVSLVKSRVNFETCEIDLDGMRFQNGESVQVNAALNVGHRFVTFLPNLVMFLISLAPLAALMGTFSLVLVCCSRPY